jgi:hypothetical protein
MKLICGALKLAVLDRSVALNNWSLLTDYAFSRLVTFDMVITLILRFYAWNTLHIMRKDYPASLLPGDASIKTRT